ncbi:MAG TPA: hypothetical protein VMM59_08830 [Thermohalobaculum sp.]|nr:hypothetical protein [Thermohalobaculum sp.]
MDSILPGQVLSELERGRRAARRGRRRRHLVVAGARQHRIVELGAGGFVIEADGLPHLRGYVEIMRGDERIARRLAQFAWARDGLVGYEFKLDAGAREAAADYERQDGPKLIAPPAGARP